MEQENIKLKEKVTLLENEILELKEHLKKYTSPTRYKKYYEKNREKITKQQIEYQKQKQKEKN
jgi:hypothetical protein